MNTKAISQQAATQFETRTGVRPLSTKTYTRGSMIGYVRFIIPVAFEEMFQRAYVEYNNRLGDMDLQFIEMYYGKPEVTIVHVSKSHFSFA